MVEADLITVGDAARLAKTTPRAIYSRVEAGSVRKAWKFGVMLVYRLDIVNYKKRSGRPKRRGVHK